jgi:hypothetical protein
LEALFEIPDEEWENVFNGEVLRIFRKKHNEGSVVTVKFTALLPKIPRNIVFSAFSGKYFL